MILTLTQRRVLILLPWLLLAAVTGAAESALPATGADLAEVVISGKKTGPGLWKISRGDHVLWLLGTPELLPARMEWDSDAVEAIMARSQARISRPRVSIKGGPIVLFRLYRQWRRMQQTDEHAPLRATLPAPLYQRFGALRQRYAPRETGWEKLRPMLAADKLFAAAIEKSGLKRARSVDVAVDRLATKHHVKVQRTELVIEQPELLLRELAETPEAAEVHCMESTVTRVETGMSASRQRAAPRANGDLKEIRALNYADNRTECAEAIAVTPRVKTLIARAQENWLQAVDTALVNNTSTVATRPIQELLQPNGVLQKLRERGYRIEAP